MDLPQSSSLEPIIKNFALNLGFDACGIARACRVDDNAIHDYDQWLAVGHNDCMEYASRHIDVRNDPRLLLDGAQSIICVAINYMPFVKQLPDAPQFSYYAYGRDYHEVVKKRLFELAAFIRELTGHESRPCVDTAPIRERYWAQQAGIGFIGRNNTLIIPGKGSFFFLGELITTLQLKPDEPCALSCADCGLCETACPGQALHNDKPLDARRCLSCQLIERRGPLPGWVAEVIGNRIYGCDTCQLVCPHNADAMASAIPEFAPSTEFLALDNEKIEQMTPGDFRRLFGHSAVRRTHLDGLKRNLTAIKSCKNK